MNSSRKDTSTDRLESFISQMSKTFIGGTMYRRYWRRRQQKKC